MREVTLNLLRTKIAEVREDSKSGSSEIAENAVRIFNQMATLLPRKKDMPLIERLAGELKQAKPSMAALTNLIDKCLEELKKQDEPFNFFPVMEKILEEKEEASRISIQKCRETIFESSGEQTLMTCSYSSAVVRLIEASAGKDFSVIAFESKFKGIDYGKAMAKKCKKMGADYEYLPEKEIDTGLKKTDCVVIGADRLLPDGSVVNGTPSLFLARKAFPDVPFYVIAESYKKGGETETESGFETIPPATISGIFSDNLF